MEKAICWRAAAAVSAAGWLRNICNQERRNERRKPSMAHVRAGRKLLARCCVAAKKAWTLAGGANIRLAVRWQVPFPSGWL